MPGYALAVVIGVQIVVPALALVDDPPARFGFQMYSALGGTSLEAFNASGKLIDVNLDSLVAGSLRPELDWTEVLPERVCGSIPEAVRVTVEQNGVRRDVQCA